MLSCCAPLCSGVQSLVDKMNLQEPEVQTLGVARESTSWTQLSTVTVSKACISNFHDKDSTTCFNLRSVGRAHCNSQPIPLAATKPAIATVLRSSLPNQAEPSKSR